MLEKHPLLKQKKRRGGEGREAGAWGREATVAGGGGAAGEKGGAGRGAAVAGAAAKAGVAEGAAAGGAAAAGGGGAGTGAAGAGGGEAVAGGGAGGGAGEGAGGGGGGERGGAAAPLAAGTIPKSRPYRLQGSSSEAGSPGGARAQKPRKHLLSLARCPSPPGGALAMPAPGH